MTALPLNGFLVLDLTAHRAGPTAVRQLADWGADVIKIEQPGEQTDATGSRRDGPDFQNLHRNKRSLTLNLKSKDGHAIFMTMAKKADVIVENFKRRGEKGQPAHRLRQYLRLWPGRAL
jgi:crotonobetainyl-CoA:carnitine CoA-transferase CaiB-like acyl-CoA transferase